MTTAYSDEDRTWIGALNRTDMHLPPITCGQTMIGGPCDRPSLHEGPDENSLSRDITKARRVFNL